MIEDDDQLTLNSRLGNGGVSVKVKLPEQESTLLGLLKNLKCRRAAVVEPALNATPLLRMIRKAGTPVYTNGRYRNANQQSQMANRV